MLDLHTKTKDTIFNPPPRFLAAIVSLIQLGADFRDELSSVLGEVSVEFRDFSLIHDPDLGGFRVQYLTADVRVVRDQHHAAFKLLERLCEGVD